MEQKKNDEIGMLDLVEEGKSSFSKVQLPTGLLDDQGVLHKEALLQEMTGREEDILSSPKMSAVQKTGQILENCVQSLGTYDHKSEKFKHYVKSLCLNDRLFLLIQIRIISLGKLFDFKMVYKKSVILCSVYIIL